MAVQYVTRRDGYYAQALEALAPAGLVPQVLAEGPPEQLENLGILDTLYKEGDLGEFQLFLQADDGMRSDVEQAIEELERELRAQGSLPWPGAARIASLDWPDRTVSLRFQQGTPLLLVLGGVLVALAAAAVTAFPDPVVSALRAIGVDTSPEVVATVAGAVTLILGLLILRGLPVFSLIPLGLFIVGGLLIFTLLRPDLAWRAIKWVGQQVVGLLERLGMNPIPLAAAVGALVLGGGLFLIGVKQALR